MSKSKAVDHVVLCLMGPAAFQCNHCGQAQSLGNGWTTATLAKQAAGYTLMHEDCEKPSRQLPLRNVPGLGSGFAEIEVPAGSTMVGVTPHHTTGPRFSGLQYGPGQDGKTSNRKPRSQKRPMILFVHASNDTHPAKRAPNHLHRTVSTVEQADSLRGLEVQSVKLLGGVWDIQLLTYLKTQVLGPMDVPVSEGKVTAATEPAYALADEPVTDGAL